jgi:hypothetical protein
VRVVVGFVALVVVLAGCRVDTRVDISVRADGSGTLQTTITLDADSVARLGGASTLGQNVPLDDLRAAAWTVSPWKRRAAGSETITLAHAFVDSVDLARRVVDLAGPHGFLRNAEFSLGSGWFRWRDALSIVVDVRSPSVDIVSDRPLAARLRAAGLDPARLQAQLAVQLKSALHVSVVVHLPDGHTESYDAATGSTRTVRVTSGGTDWNRITELGIGLTLALLAVGFFLAAAVGARRSRERQRRL